MAGRGRRAFLRAQLRHVEVQTQYLEQEHALRLFGLRMRSASSHERGRNWEDPLKSGGKLVVREEGSAR